MIYFVGPAEYGSPVRIFYAKKGTLPSVMSLMREGNHRELHLLGEVRGGRLKEAILHRKYRAHRIRGDWFRGARIPRNVPPPLETRRRTC